MSENETLIASLVETVMSGDAVEFINHEDIGAVVAKVYFRGELFIADGDTIGAASAALRRRLRHHFSEAVESLKAGGLDVVSLLTTQGKAQYRA